ncbi:MAG: site-2 protease family protein [bacterium]|nr:site-2 protease family protein [bacterium]
MPLGLLSDQPIIFVVWVLAIIVALSVHEFSHALVGNLLGDSTARNQGRLTLNPLAHIDPIGFFMLLLVGFGWGKPVPFNPYNLKYPKWGPAIVGLAGPVANLVGLLVSGVLLKALLFFGNIPFENLLVQFLLLLVVVNLVLLLFNLLPIPPLDGSKLFLSIFSAPHHARLRFLLETRGPLLLLGLIILDRLFGFNIFGRLFGGIIKFVFGLF